MSVKKITAVGPATLAQILGLGAKSTPKPEPEAEVQLLPIAKRKIALTPEQVQVAEEAAQRAMPGHLRKARGSATMVFATSHPW